MLKFVAVASALALVVGCSSANSPDDAAETSSEALAGQTVLETGDRALCTGFGWLFPELPRGANTPVATRLVPPSYPFQVTSIEYDLFGAPIDPNPAHIACDSGLPHAIIVWTGAAGAAPVPNPPASASYRRIPVEANEAAGTDQRTVKVEIPDGITLQTGEELFVGIEMAGNASSTRVTCAMYCQRATPAVRGVDFWAGRPRAPFRWSDLTPNFSGNQMTRARGSRIELPTP